MTPLKELNSVEVADALLSLSASVGFPALKYTAASASTVSRQLGREGLLGPLVKGPVPCVCVRACVRGCFRGPQHSSPTPYLGSEEKSTQYMRLFLYLCRPLILYIRIKT